MVEAGALAGHDQRRLAGEGGVEHAVRARQAPSVLLAMVSRPSSSMACRVMVVSSDAGIAEHPEHLLLVGPVQEPVLDLADRPGLQVGWREALAHEPSQQRPA